MPGCDVCGFQLWTPVVALGASQLSLYDDSRFPGRCILMLNNHEEELDDLDEELLLRFMKDIQLASKAIKMVTSSGRVNVAVLGNAVAHVHAHLIPRFPEQEPNPTQSPWNDTREKTGLPAEVKELLVQQLRDAAHRLR
jgi:diadenosine tetraphosphate (Ap4A) HIT family hydrolase